MQGNFVQETLCDQDKRRKETTPVLGRCVSGPNGRKDQPLRKERARMLHTSIMMNRHNHPHLSSSGSSTPFLVPPLLILPTLQPRLARSQGIPTLTIRIFYSFFFFLPLMFDFLGTLASQYRPRAANTLKIM